MPFPSRYYYRFVCATCHQGPTHGVSTYQLVARGLWKCWDHMSEDERRECIR